MAPRSTPWTTITVRRLPSISSATGPTCAGSCSHAVPVPICSWRPRWAISIACVGIWTTIRARSPCGSTAIGFRWSIPRGTAATSTSGHWIHVSAFEDRAQARPRGDVLGLLLERAGPLERLLDALWRGDGAAADAGVLAAAPALVDRASERALRAVADAARNNNGRGGRGDARARLPGDGALRMARCRCTGLPFMATPEMLRGVLERDPPLKACDLEFKGTAVGWLIQGALGGWRGMSTGRHDDCAR